MEERGLVGLEARAADGTEIGRITEVVVDGETGGVTHVVVMLEEELVKVPISAISLDAEADFATFHAEGSDEEPGDHAGDVETPQGYAPARSDGPDDYEHEGQFVSTPQDPDEGVSLAEQGSTEADEAGGWEDEGSTTADSGYPRNDAYIDPDTGEEGLDPRLEENETLADDVEDLLADTELEVRSAEDGIVELTGAAATQEDLEEAVAEITGLDGVREVDTADVEVG